MVDPELEDLVAYIAETNALGPSEAKRLVGDVLSFLDESPENFLRRRHRAFQRAGYANSEIFARVAAEVAVRRFRAPTYSERQIRRIIYG